MVSLMKIWILGELIVLYAVDYAVKTSCISSY